MYAFCPLFLERLKDEGRRLKKNVNFINLFGISFEMGFGLTIKLGKDGGERKRRGR